MKKSYLSVVFLVLSAGLVLVGQNVQNPPDAATVRGKIIFQGTLPPATQPNRASDPFCAALPPNNDGLEDVMVYVKPVGQTSYAPPASTIVIDRKECRFVPHTVTVQVGQTVVIRNSDGTAHNAHGWSVNTPFNVALPRAGTETRQVFQKEEVPFPIRDDVHNWEVAQVGVFAHPYHTVSKLNGDYEFKLPAGPYQIVARHEKLGTQTVSFEVKPAETRTLDFVFK